MGTKLEVVKVYKSDKTRNKTLLQKKKAVTCHNFSHRLSMFARGVSAFAVGGSNFLQG